MGKTTLDAWKLQTRISWVPTMSDVTFEAIWAIIIIQTMSNFVYNCQEKDSYIVDFACQLLILLCN